MSKLIVLNGPLGSGKSTLARAYADSHPLTLTLDIDEIWFMISHWRENWEESSPLAKDMAFSMAKVYLSAGHDIIAPQVILEPELRERFKLLAQETGSELYEILLDLPKDKALQRYRARLQKTDQSNGYKPDTNIAAEDKEKRWLERYERMMAALIEEGDALRITPAHNKIDACVLAIEELLSP